MKNLSEGITLGILGGGQLGRMSAMAAARLGIKVIVLCPEENSPASHVCDEIIISDYDNIQNLEIFTEKCDYISYEFENIPVKTIDYISSLNKSVINPSRKLLDVSQDRIKEKTFLNTLGIQTTEWGEVKDYSDVSRLLNLWNVDFGIIKTARFGYDGKGQEKIKKGDEKATEDFLRMHTGNQFILEKPVTFIHEMSVIIARDMHGKSVCYDTMLNEHLNHILHKTTVNSAVSALPKSNIVQIAECIADAIDLIGVLTVELFCLENGQILANEIAPRTHNSGHWTIDACSVSQFENHVRCVCGLDVGSASRHSDAEMLNLIGNDVLNIQSYIRQDNTCVHLYGKTEIKNGRKMGHVTFLKPKTNN